MLPSAGDARRVAVSARAWICAVVHATQVFAEDGKFFESGRACAGGNESQDVSGAMNLTEKSQYCLCGSTRCRPC